MSDISKSFFGKLSPKFSFFAGAGTALAIFFVIGFFVLLAIVLKDDDADTKVAGTTAPTPSVQQPSQQAAAAIDDVALVPVSSDDWIKGDPNARISLVEFSDLECPFCKQYHTTLQKLLDAYPNDVSWVYRHFPLVSLHSKAPKEAEATECAGELGGNEAFWAYTDELFRVTPSNDGLDLNELPEIATRVGLDRNQFTECLDSGRHAGKVQDHYNQAIAAGGQGTPFSVIIVDGEKIPVPGGAVPFEQLDAFISSVLAE